MSKISKKKYVAAFFLAPPLGIAVMCAFILMIGDFGGLFQEGGNFLYGVLGLMFFGSLLGGYPVMLLIGLPVMALLEKKKMNGVLAYVVLGAAAGLGWGAGVLGGELNIVVACTMAGFATALTAYVLLHGWRWSVFREHDKSSGAERRGL